MVPTKAKYEAATSEDLEDRSEVDTCAITLGNLNKQAFVELRLSIKHKIENRRTAF